MRTTTRKVLATCGRVRNDTSPADRRARAKMHQAERLMEHEEHRWSYMTVKQLTTRLGKITKPEKLRNFIELADRYGEVALGRAAIRRLAMFH